MKKQNESGRVTNTDQGPKKKEEGLSMEVPEPTATPTTKVAKVIALLREPKGATLQTIMAATGWQSHSVRGFISAQLIKKRKLRVRSFKRAEERVYKISR
jgi:hypothetical protein